MSRRVIPRIAIAFEFNTLSGGERSMLAALDSLRDFAQFVALAPAGGRLETELSQRGIEHLELVLRDSEGHRLPRETVRAQLLELVRRASPDLLHANSLAMGRLTGAVADDLAIPCVGHLRDIIRLSPAALADLNRNRLLIAVSEATRRFHVAQGLNPEQVVVAHNGVDCEQFAPRPATGWVREELGLDPSVFLVATIGQIGLRKGHDVLAQAAALGADRLPDVHYVIVGERYSAKAESVEFERAIEHRFEKADIADRLHRLGFRDDIDRLLNEIDLLVHPARQEPLGRVLLETAAAGRPIVATDVGGTSEILRDGESARLVSPDDPRALAAAIAELYGDPRLRSGFAQHARRRIEAGFSLPAAARRLRSIWSGVARAR